MTTGEAVLCDEDPIPRELGQGRGSREEEEAGGTQLQLGQGRGSREEEEAGDTRLPPAVESGRVSRKRPQSTVSVRAPVG